MNGSNTWTILANIAMKSVTDGKRFAHEAMENRHSGFQLSQKKPMYRLLVANSTTTES